VLPALGIVIYSGVTRLQSDIEVAQNDALIVLQSLAYDHERSVESTRQFLMTLAKLPDVQNQNAPACNKLFRVLHKENPIYTTILMSNTEGIVFANALPFTPYSVKQRKYFLDSLRTKEFSVGEYLIGIPSGRPALPFAHPVIDSNGRLKAVVAVGIDLERYGQMFTKTKLPEGSEFGIFDHKNVRLYRAHEPEKFLGETDPPEMIKHMSAQPEEGIFTAVGVDGTKRLYAYKRFYLKDSTSPYLFMRVGIPEAQVLSQARNTLLINVALLCAAFIMAMVLAWFLGKGIIVRRLDKLADAALRLGHGDLAARTGLDHSEDELGKVITAFDEMAGELELKESERRFAEEALRESEAKYRALVETTNTGFVIIDPEGRVLDANQEYVRLTGHRDPKEILGRSVVEWTADHEKERNRESVRKCFEKGHVRNLEIDYMDSQGNTTPIEINATLVEIKGRPQILTLCRDITDRKLAEEALRKSEAKYRELVENANSIIFRRDKDGHVTFFNEFAQQFFGYSEDEILGKNVVGTIIPEVESTGRDLKTMIEDIGLNPDRYINNINENMRRNGERVWIAWTNKPIRDENGEVTEILCIGNDITERKQAEQERKVLEERLQRAEKMEALGTLAGGVAHDLNNVLGIVVGYSELLLGKIGESSPIRSYVMNIMQGGERAAAIVQDLLTLARRGVHTGKVINLNTTIIDFQKSPEFMNLSSFHPKVHIQTNLYSDLLNITGSPVHLSKTLMNLVSNAAEAMPNGGELVIATSNQYLDRPVQGYDDVEEGDYVVLSVSDTGEGIPVADLKRIFEPFYTKKVMGRSGTGLGLAVVWGTVKDHNGYINVQSEEGKGSTFTIYFPVTREEISEEEIYVPVSEYTGNGESILVVDDVKGQRDLATQMLNKLQYNVTTVPNGEEAVEYVKKNRVDLIVLDMIMDPGIDGLDTYRRILEINPKQKAIIVSGFSETDRVDQAKGLGAGAYLKKPYVLARLGLAVRRELDKSISKSM
jgi:PAS domain S-box-containing protein